jgi:hypothetical protein
MSNERDELADTLQQYALAEDRRDVRTWADYADAILAAGYRRTEPRWADVLTNDGKYEYTVSSDCDGSNLQKWRRMPGKLYIEDASPWEVYEPAKAATTEEAA